MLHAPLLAVQDFQTTSRPVCIVHSKIPSEQGKFRLIDPGNTYSKCDAVTVTRNLLVASYFACLAGSSYIVGTTQTQIITYRFINALRN